MTRWLEGLPAWAQTTVTVVAILAATALAMFVVGKLIRGMYRRKSVDDAITVNVTVRLVQAFLAFVGLELLLHHYGIQLGTVFAAGGMVAVGVGFGAKNLIENMIAGIIIRLDRTVRRGDIIEINGRWLKVRHISLRATITDSYAEEEVIIPNSLIVQSTVSSLTRHGALYRIRVDVGVAYESDLKLVRKTLEDCVEELEFRSKERKSLVILDEFADSSVNYSVRVWIDNADNALQHRSQLREAVWWALQDAKITIAFPQLDVHLDRTDD